MSVHILQGDCRDVLRTLPDQSVHCIVTSPPYFGLRDYGTATWEGGNPECEHTNARRCHNGEKQSTSVGTSRDSLAGSRECRHCGATRIDQQIGLEQTPDEYVAQLVAVFCEARRVLRDDGTLWLNLGDSYASSSKGSGGTGASGLMRDGRPESGRLSADAANGRAKYEPRRFNMSGFKPKDLIGIPWRVAFALQAPDYLGRITRESDRAWLAALVDGEGCFFIHKCKAVTPAYSSYVRADGTETSYSRTADTYGVGLEISNTSKALIDRVAEIVPDGTFTMQSSEQNDRRKQTIYRWRLAPNATKRLAQELYPHLVAKQRQARLIFSCPSKGHAGAAAHQAMMDLHNGSETEVDFPAPPSLFEPGWYLRQDIIWGKPNPMPESVTDRCTKAHEYVFMLSKSARYFYDAEAISEPAVQDEFRPSFRGGAYVGNSTFDNQGNGGHSTDTGNVRKPNAMRNKRSVWTIAARPSGEEHFAMMPPALAELCIKAGCPPKGVVLDPFAGVGTTGLVADRLGRDAVLIELSMQYAASIRRRIENDAGMFAAIW